MKQNIIKNVPSPNFLGDRQKWLTSDASMNYVNHVIMILHMFKGSRPSVTENIPP